MAPGPAGLATAVYAASEGLSVVVLDTRVIGGQAGASSRIENYLGFPTGISGQALAGRGATSRHRNSALTLPYRFCDEDRMRSIAARRSSSIAERVSAPKRWSSHQARLIAVRRLPTSLASRAVASITGHRLSRRNCVVRKKWYWWVAVIPPDRQSYISRHASHVHLLIRGADLGKSMSRYLVDRIASLRERHLRTQTELIAIQGTDDGVAACAGEIARPVSRMQGHSSRISLCWCRSQHPMARRVRRQGQRQGIRVYWS